MRERMESDHLLIISVIRGKGVVGKDEEGEKEEEQERGRLIWIEKKTEKFREEIQQKEGLGQERDGRERVKKILRAAEWIRSLENKQELGKERRNVRDTIKEGREKWRRELWEEVAKAKDMKMLWEAINKFRNKGSCKTTERIAKEQ
ncbi:hypothetical protein M0804_013341 [Polistes exclamans]|nr:hypothetical protein M0804_013341 [Polistes exclamans]